MSAFSVPPKNLDNDNAASGSTDSPFMTSTHPEALRAAAPPGGLESMLQESMILQPVGLAADQGWSTGLGSDLTSRSSEFKPMPRLPGAAKKFGMADSIGGLNARSAFAGEAGANLSPKIKVRKLRFCFKQFHDFFA